MRFTGDLHGPALPYGLRLRVWFFLQCERFHIHVRLQRWLPRSALHNRGWVRTLFFLQRQHAPHSTCVSNGGCQDRKCRMDVGCGPNCFCGETRVYPDAFSCVANNSCKGVPCSNFQSCGPNCFCAAYRISPTDPFSCVPDNSCEGLPCNNDAGCGPNCKCSSFTCVSIPSNVLTT